MFSLGAASFPSTVGLERITALELTGNAALAVSDVRYALSPQFDRALPANTFVAFLLRFPTWQTGRLLPMAHLWAWTDTGAGDAVRLSRALNHADGMYASKQYSGRR